ncbi:MAG: translation initiation factor IF-2 subunit alpha [Thermoprotei archaeon]|nr:MAG: translation initiation factor IF-2 subunit alpha [Thermoprotei archaeon]
MVNILSSLRRRKIPEVGELVIGTVKKVFEYGAYVKLEEYEGLEAYLPWSEITTKWMRDIRDYVREGQRIVAKVIRVDKRKYPPHIDISMKRVSSGEQRIKMMRWKREQKALRVLELLAEKLGKSAEELYEILGKKLERAYGELLAAFEEIAIRGPEVLRTMGIPNEWIDVIVEEIKRHVEVKKVKIKGIITLRTLKPNGVELIKKALTKGLEVKTAPGTSVRMYSIGSPRYRVEITSTDYKTAEKVMKNIVNEILRIAKQLGIEEASFQREELR